MSSSSDEEMSKVVEGDEDVSIVPHEEPDWFDINFEEATIVAAVCFFMSAFGFAIIYCVLSRYHQRLNAANDESSGTKPDNFWDPVLRPDGGRLRHVYDDEPSSTDSCNTLARTGSITDVENLPPTSQRLTVQAEVCQADESSGASPSPARNRAALSRKLGGSSSSPQKRIPLLGQVSSSQKGRSKSSPSDKVSERSSSRNVAGPSSTRESSSVLSSQPEPYSPEEVFERLSKFLIEVHRSLSGNVAGPSPTRNSSSVSPSQPQPGSPDGVSERSSGVHRSLSGNVAGPSPTRDSSSVSPSQPHPGSPDGVSERSSELLVGVHRSLSGNVAGPSPTRDSSSMLSSEHQSTSPTVFTATEPHRSFQRSQETPTPTESASPSHHGLSGRISSRGILSTSFRRSPSLLPRPIRSPAPSRRMIPAARFPQMPSPQRAPLTRRTSERPSRISSPLGTPKRVTPSKRISEVSSSPGPSRHVNPGRMSEISSHPQRHSTRMRNDTPRTPPIQHGDSDDESEDN